MDALVHSRRDRELWISELELPLLRDLRALRGFEYRIELTACSASASQHIEKHVTVDQDRHELSTYESAP